MLIRSIFGKILQEQAVLALFILKKFFDTAQNADYWIGAGLYTSLAEMLQANPHYKEFKAFKEGNVYSFSTKKEPQEELYITN